MRALPTHMLDYRRSVLSMTARTMTTQPSADHTGPRRSERARIIISSLVGTTIEFYDFYAYATAAISVFPILFFHSTSETGALLASLATFGVAFVARPIGSVLFGHFGDRVGRKATLVASLLTMGIATVVIGLLPTMYQIGLWAPALLAIMRFCQGLGLGGEWSGASLLAGENARPGKRGGFFQLETHPQPKCNDHRREEEGETPAPYEEGMVGLGGGGVVAHGERQDEKEAVGQEETDRRTQLGPH